MIEIKIKNIFFYNLKKNIYIDYILIKFYIFFINRNKINFLRKIHNNN
jgi:hypothetical protein